MRILGRPIAAVLLGLLRLTPLKAGVAVYWHGVGDPQEDPALHLVPRMGTGLFRAQLRYLTRHYRPVTASELENAVAERGFGQRFPVALTFDDDLSSHRKVGLELLPEAGARATFFLCGATLDGPHPFWWQRLGASSEARATAEHVKSLTRRERRAFEERLAQDSATEPAEEGLRRDHVRALAGAGHEIGFHTLHHDPLPTLDSAELDAALADGREALDSAAENPLHAIAYPHGEWDGRTPAAARETGFQVGFTTAQRAIRRADDPLVFGRLEAPFDSVDHLAFRLARALARRTAS